MPLRDHFLPPLADLVSWDALHGQWPAMMVIELNRRLPPLYVAQPRVHLGTAFEVDIGMKEYLEKPAVNTDAEMPDSNGGVATLTYAPPKPTLAVATELPDQDEYEVRIFRTDEWRLVAAIEIVSPANKDRPENRRAFTAKCATLLRQGVSVSIVDVVTARRTNLYGELLDLIGKADPSLAPTPPVLYAASCRWREVNRSTGRLETWTHQMSVGEPLPTLPLWLAEDYAVPLNLESSYEETCRVLRIA